MLTGFSGCRSARDNQIDILESKLRNQEDYIYELEDYVVEYSDKLRGCRSCQPHEVVVDEAISAPEFDDAEPYGESDSHTVKQPPKEEPAEEPVDEPLPEPDPPEAQPLEESSPDPSELEVPDLEFEIDDSVGELDLPLEQLEEADALFAADDSVVDNSAEDDGNQFVTIPDPAEYEFSPTVDTHVDTNEEEFDEAFIDDAEVAEVAFEEVNTEEEEDILVYRQPERIVITEILRSDIGDNPASALLTIVEARDANNEPADLQGMVSLMVMTAREASKRRLKRWDFSEEETVSAWQTSELGDGLHLELPLGENPLPNEPIELWARLMTDDGRKMLARLPFNQTKLAALGEEPEPYDEAEAELALAEARPLGGQVDKLAVDKTEAKQLARPKTQWRASVQAAHLATEAKTTSSSTTGWKSSRQNVAQTSRTLSTKKPVWTTGRAAASNWSTQR